jgi:hypothetical protein
MTIGAEVIPHVYKSLHEITVKARALPAPKRLRYLEKEHRQWCELRETFTQNWPLDDGTDFALVIAGIRRLHAREAR